MKWGQIGVVVLLSLVISGCDKGGFSFGDMTKGGTTPQRKLGLIAPVPLKPAKAFSGQRHLGLEILTAGYDRVPYFVSAPSKVTLTLEPCQAIYLAGDAEGKQSMQLDNFLLVEVVQAGRKQSVVLGDVETVRALGKELPHIGPDSRVIPAGMPRLDKVIKPGEPVDITVTALSNQDMGGVGPIFLIVEKPIGQGGDQQSCGAGQSNFVTEGRRAQQKQAAPGTQVFRTPEERAKSFKTMSADNIPGARPPLSNGGTAPPPMPAIGVEAAIIPGSKGMPEVTPQMRERMQNFRATPAPDKAPSEKLSPEKSLSAKPVKQAPPPLPAVKAPIKTVPNPAPPVSKPAMTIEKPRLSPPSPEVKPKNTNKSDIPAPKIIVAPQFLMNKPNQKPAQPSETPAQPVLGSVTTVGKYITRNENGKITTTFVPADPAEKKKTVVKSKPVDPDKKDQP
jgi:hypothetical protein